MLLARMAASSSAGTSEVSAYASSLAAAISQLDGRAAARLLSLRDADHIDALQAHLSGDDSSAGVASDLQDLRRALVNVEQARTGEGPWSGMAGQHCAAIRSRSGGDGGLGNEAVFAAQLDLCRTFLAWFSSGATAWALPVLYTITRELKDVAVMVDNTAREAKRKVSKLEEAGRIITRGWTACLNDRTVPLPLVPNRHLGTYYMAALLFKIYFKLGTLSLCKNIIRGIQNQAELPPLESFPISHQVTYRYYLGLLSFLNERYEDAEWQLTYALQQCHSHSKHNFERILRYLIPIRLLRGILPSQKMLADHRRLDSLYSPFISAYRRGDLRSYDDSLLRLRGDLVRCSTFLVVERAREGCLRMLFKRVWLCSDRGSRLLVGTVQRSLAHVKIDVTGEEVECLLANLVHKGHLRGYISHERQTVVLAKDNPFPPLVGRALSNSTT